MLMSFNYGRERKYFKINGQFFYKKQNEQELLLTERNLWLFDGHDK